MKTIAIVGGGTAGWLTAHQFLRKINYLRVSVTDRCD